MTAPDAPREAEVRKALASLCVSHPHFTRLAGDVLALLDAGRKDRERVEEALVIYHHAFVTGSTPPVSAQVVAREYVRQHRAAIDQTSGA